MTTPAEIPEAPTPLLRITGMSKMLPGLKAVAEVPLVAHPGEVVAVLGHNGSGTTELVKILAGVHQAHPGATVQAGDAEGGLLTGAGAAGRHSRWYWRVRGFGGTAGDAR